MLCLKNREMRGLSREEAVVKISDAHRKQAGSDNILRIQGIGRSVR
jgi:hypothetical protein